MQIIIRYSGYQKSLQNRLCRAKLNYTTNGSFKSFWPDTTGRFRLQKKKTFSPGRLAQTFTIDIDHNSLLFRTSLGKPQLGKKWPPERTELENSVPDH